MVILFVFVGLLLGSILREVNKKTKIPYTPMLLVLGIVLGYFRESLGIVGESTSIIERLNPHMILFIFIPVLIFESGTLSINFKRLIVIGMYLESQCSTFSFSPDQECYGEPFWSESASKFFCSTLTHN